MCQESRTELGPPDELFTDPSGDFFLSSSFVDDDHVFQVSKAYLAYSSEFFRGMFTIHDASGQVPGSTDIEGTSSCPLRLETSSDVLDTIFHIIYATGYRTTIEKVELYFKCLLFADKYVMEGVTRILRLTFNHRAQDDPVTAYIVARKLEWETEAATAKGRAMFIDIWPFASTKIVEIHNSDGDRFLVDLLVAHNAVRQASLHLTQEMLTGKWDDFWWARAGLVCSCNTTNAISLYSLYGHKEIPIWMSHWGTGMLKVLEGRAKLRSAQVESLAMEVVSEAPRTLGGVWYSCGDCANNMRLHLDTIRRFGTQLEGLPVPADPQRSVISL